MDYQMIEITGMIALAIVLVLMAAFDIFWPVTVALVLVGAGVWWREGLVVFWLLWRPEIIAGYIAIGFAWVFFKWTRLIEQELRQGATRPPKWSSRSYDFAAYFFYWPLDAVAYLLSDFLQNVWRFIARIVGRSFDRYAEWRFATAKARNSDWRRG
jgi:hypothetical protein